MESKRYLEHPSGISVELLESLGTDLSVVNAARVSYGKESQYERYKYCHHYQQFYLDNDKANYCSYCQFDVYTGRPYQPWTQCLSERDAGILNYMMRDKHGSPFEMVVFKFRIHVPIGVGREWMRHRIGSFNEMSTRYVKWSKEYYIPQKEDWRKQVGKPGHYKYVPIDDGSEHHISVIYEYAMEDAFHYYNQLIELGLAREVARNVLPIGSFTSFIWTVNLRSLFNFISLRTHETALKEIQIAANMVQELAEQVVPESMNAWRRHGKQTP